MSLIKARIQFKNQLAKYLLILSSNIEKVAHKIEMPELAETSSKRRVKTMALLMMYSGWGYYGMQRNNIFPTIEGELMKAMRAANVIDDEAFESQKLIHFQRASKTDKNVSAIGQVCSMNLRESDNPVPLINEHLPEQIRVLDLFRVTRTFNAKGNTHHRIYKYLMPSFALAPKEFLNECHVFDEDRDMDRTKLWTYRLPASRLSLTNQILNTYKGTRNYYNFTSGRGPNDSSCKRYILSINAEEPFLQCGDREFIVITVEGQSFMLHQIRKMVGLMIAVVNGSTGEDIFDKVFVTDRLDIPKAPGLGLLLDRVDYTTYNIRHCQTDTSKAIDWSRYEELMNTFKHDVIYKDIIEKEIDENSMMEWLRSLPRHCFAYRADSDPLAAQISDQLDNADQNDAEDNDDRVLCKRAKMESSKCVNDQQITNNPKKSEEKLELKPVEIVSIPSDEKKNGLENKCEIEAVKT